MRDLKSLGHCVRVGSTPTSSTNSIITNDHTIFGMNQITKQAANIEENVELSNIFDDLIKEQQKTFEDLSLDDKVSVANAFMALVGMKNSTNEKLTKSYLGKYKNQKEFAKEVARKSDRFPQWIFPSIDFQAFYYAELSPFVKQKFGHFFLVK